MLPALSVAVTVTVEVPAVVGFPVVFPVGASVIPGANAPEVTAKEYGPAPPLAVKVTEYAAPTVAAGSVRGARASATVMDSCAVAVFAG